MFVNEGKTEFRTTGVVYGCPAANWLAHVEEQYFASLLFQIRKQLQQHERETGVKLVVNAENVLTVLVLLQQLVLTLESSVFQVTGKDASICIEEMRRSLKELAHGGFLTEGMGPISVDTQQGRVPTILDWMERSARAMARTLVENRFLPISRACRIS